RTQIYRLTSEGSHFLVDGVTDRRQERAEGGEWLDASVDADTQIQLENKILERARSLKASEIG
ncbi:MAG: DUF3576 domain-containing protein, partial [Cyanobacteria bacterium J06555_3]